jgi:hypothetical protein
MQAKIVDITCYCALVFQTAFCVVITQTGCFVGGSKSDNSNYEKNNKLQLSKNEKTSEKPIKHCLKLENVEWMNLIEPLYKDEI